MGIELTSREVLRSEIQQFQEAQIFCYSLNTSATRSLSDITGFSPSADIEEPPVKSGSEQLTLAFQQAMQILTMPEWSNFANESVSTVTREPLPFGKAVMEGTYKHIEEEIKALADLGKDFIKWLGEFADCIKDVKFNVFDPDKILASDACEPFHDTATLILKFQDMIAELEALGLMGILEFIMRCLSYVTEILAEVLITGLTALGEQAASIKVWLEETAKSALSIGNLIGKLLGIILIELGTSGMGRAIKSTSIIKKLPDNNFIPLGDPNDREVRNVAQIHSISRSSSAKKELEILIEVYQSILNKNGKRFSRNLTTAKLRILRKHLGPEHFKKFATNRKALERYVVASVKRVSGKVGAYGTLKDEAREYSRRSLAFLYSDHLVGDTLPDEFAILAGKYEVLPNIFEANHIIEQRAFKAGKVKWKTEFAKLGWKTEEDMTAVLLTADEHTGSIRAMLRKQMLPDGLPTDPNNQLYKETVQLLDDLDNSLPKSITRTLIDEINVEDQDSFSKLLAKYAEVYSREAPKVWKKTLHNTFSEWVKTLGYDDIVLPPKL